MQLNRIALSTFFIGAMAVSASTTYAQTYPSRPIRIITVSIGSNTDTVARLIAQALSPRVGQGVIVDNRGAGFIQGELLSKAPPDGHTLCITAGGLWVAPLLQKAPYDPATDFAPISLITSSPNVLFVNPSVPATSVKELIALAKAKPGTLNYAAGGTGGTSHLAAELLNALAGTNIVRIPYKTGSQQTADLLTGQVQMQFNTVDASYREYIKTGRLRPIAVGSLKPTALLPGVPTLASTLPGFESVVALAMFAPAKTPKAAVMRINEEVARILNTDDAKTRLTAIAVEPVASSPEGLVEAMAADTARVRRLIKEGRITPE